MSRYFLCVVVLFIFLISCSHNSEVPYEEYNSRCITVSVQSPTGIKSIYRDPHSLSLITKWHVGFFDLDVFLRQGERLELIKGVEIKEDGYLRTHSFQLTLPDWVDVSKEYSLIGVIAENVKLLDNVPLVGVGGRLMYELVENSPNSDRFAPTYFGPLTIKGIPDTPLSTRFNHLGAIAVVTLKNSATVPLTTAGVAIVPDRGERPFYHPAALPFIGDVELPYINLLALNNPVAMIRTSVTYPSTTLAPGEVKSLGFWFRPLGIETPAIRLAMYEVANRVSHLSKTSKPSKTVKMASGRAYHFFAEWNGEELLLLGQEPKGK